MTDLIAESIMNAGPVMYVLFAVCMGAWFIIISKTAMLRTELKRSSSFITQIRDHKDTDFDISGETALFDKYLAPVLQEEQPDSVEMLITEKGLGYEQIIMRNLSTVSVLAAIAPLLGLLGTVTGMIRTFTVIKLFGGANPALMAEGISEALLTTQAGLIVAFPVLAALSGIRKKADAVLNNFNKVCMRIKVSRNVFNA